MARKRFVTQQAQESQFVFALFALPTCIYTVLCICFLTTFENARWVTWLLTLMLFSSSLVATVRGARRPPVRRFAVGFWCLLTVVGTVSLALYVNVAYLEEYRQLLTEQPLTDLDPLSAHVGRDAVVVTFASNSFIDDRRTAGFIANGHIYCVAPVACRGEPSSEVNFWAVGVDCCEQRSNFDCRAARDPGPLKAIATPARTRRFFESAARLAESVHNVTSPQGAMLVSFVGDTSAEEYLWKRALILLVIGGFVHFSCTSLIALVLMGAGRQVVQGIAREDAVKKWVEQGCQPYELDGALEWEQLCNCLGPRSQLLSDSLRWEQMDIEAWEQRNNQDQHNFFDNVFVAEDGGLTYEVKDLVEQMGPVHYLFSLVTPASILFNTVYILKTDIPHLRSTAQNSQGTPDWCVTGYLVENAWQVFVGNDHYVHVPAQIPVAVMELLFLGAKYFAVAFFLVEMLVTKEARRVWSNASRIFWYQLPALSVFSAMQLFSYVVPSILKIEMTPKLESFLDDPDWKELQSLVFFCVSRVLLAVAGFDAFLVKFRICMRSVAADSMSISNILGGLGFVFQLVGVVDLTYWTRNRLFAFIFAKADGKLSDKERADMSVYQWILAKKVWEASRGSVVRFCVTMLTFSDHDFQRLVLNEKGRAIEGTGARDRAA